MPLSPEQNDVGGLSFAELSSVRRAESRTVLNLLSIKVQTDRRRQWTLSLKWTLVWVTETRLEPKSRKHTYPISRDVNSWRGKQQLTPNDCCENVQNSLRRRVNYRRTITSGVSGSDLRFSNNYFCTVNSQSSNTSNSISPNDELYVYAQNRNPCLFWSRAYQRPIKARLGLLLVMSSHRMRSAALMVF